MKKITLILILLVSSLSFAQTTIEWDNNADTGGNNNATPLVITGRFTDTATGLLVNVTATLSGGANSSITIPAITANTDNTQGSNNWYHSWEFTQNRTANGAANQTITFAFDQQVQLNTFIIDDVDLDDQTGGFDDQFTLSAGFDNCNGVTDTGAITTDITTTCSVTPHSSDLIINVNDGGGNYGAIFSNGTTQGTTYTLQFGGALVNARLAFTLTATLLDTDNDLIPDSTDADDDNDGILDVNETSGNNNPIGDEDGDGILNYQDLTDNGNGGDGSITTYTDANGDGVVDVFDADNDGTPNHLDLDSDNDGCSDTIENGFTDNDNDGILGVTPVTVNANGQITGQGGYTGTLLVAVINNTANFACDDMDNDGILDSADLDDDNDGIPDSYELCGTAAQATVTAATINITIDLDQYENETTWTLVDPNGTTVASGGTYAGGDDIININHNAYVNGSYIFTINDSFGDGLNGNNGSDENGTSGYTIDVNGTNVFTSAASPDFGNQDVQNIVINTIQNSPFDCFATNPMLDDDNDGIVNYKDADFCTLNANGICVSMDTDGDGIPNHLDLDSDNDGILDVNEGGNGVLDTNKDGMIDNNDTGYTDANNDGQADASVDANEEPDTDGDNKPDYKDLDADNDGINDVDENGNETADTNGDGMVNGPDADNDGIQDSVDADDTNFGEGTNGEGDVVDTDGDTVPNYKDLDSDNDGINDTIEGGNHGSDTNGDGVIDNNDTGGDDTDGDGIPDSVDGNIGGFGDTGDAPHRDTDNDGIPDSEDLDSDDDGVNDITEGGNDAPDADGNGMVDGPDGDGDGIQDGVDQNPGGFGDTGNTNTPPNDPTNPYDPTSGGNGVLGCAGVDIDQDGIADCEDDDTAVIGEGPKDTDGDGTPDSVDVDDDNDGIADVNEGNGNNNATGDEDGDGIANWKDIIDNGNGGDGSITNYTDADNNRIPDVFDTDGDGVANHLDLDSDNDSILDVDESGNGAFDTTKNGTIDTNDTGFADANNDGQADATLVTTNPDTDGDTVLDYLDLDSDNDGINDVDENEINNSGTADANRDGMVDGVDTDKDGIADLVDMDNNNFGEGTDGEGENVDTDSDNVPDYKDLDSDNDGINDTIESGNHDKDTNNDGTINGSDTGGGDTDGDGIPDSVDGNTPGFGDTNNPPHRDTDNDGIPDSRDLDSDDDGVNDIIEGNNDGPTTDADGNGVLDGPDTDGDGIQDVVDENPSGFGDTGNNDTPPNDTFDPYNPNDGGTGVLPCAGTDMDQDGIADCEDSDNNSFGEAQAGKLAVKVMLQGALLNSTGNKMRTDLTAGGYVPTTEPYSTSGNAKFTAYGNGGGETTTLATLNANAGTDNAIVDWVFVELRDANDNTIILETRAALVQKDGDVVDEKDGTSALSFPGAAGNSYYVVIKHRNHLGAMFTNTVALSTTVTTVDFTTAIGADLFDKTGAINYNGNEQITVGAVQALHAGNANADNQVGFSNGTSDFGSIQIDTLLHPNNTTYYGGYDFGNGYFDGDINMDGKVSFTASNADAGQLQIIVLLYPLNTTYYGGYDFIIEQLP